MSQNPFFSNIVLHLGEQFDENIEHTFFFFAVTYVLLDFFANEGCAFSWEQVA